MQKDNLQIALIVEMVHIQPQVPVFYVRFIVKHVLNLDVPDVIQDIISIVMVFHVVLRVFILVKHAHLRIQKYVRLAYLAIP